MGPPQTGWWRAHIQFAIYPGMDLSHYLAERERWEWDALEITLYCTEIHRVLTVRLHVYKH